LRFCGDRFETSAEMPDGASSSATLSPSIITATTLRLRSGDGSNSNRNANLGESARYWGCGDVAGPHARDEAHSAREMVAEALNADRQGCQRVSRKRTTAQRPLSNAKDIIFRKGDANLLEDMEALKRFFRDESGATAIEYGQIAAGISVAIIHVVNALGSQLKSTFTTISSQLATAGK
jgi:pilus assembly protein Flp/PilA